ncbi:MAG: hypothetical protein KJO49_03860 [Bacteroidia bacterium]|nr:hypothetical protein [Bacteroidia bacterium]MBT8268625.1 hypothetical protein [Bacteroidia bacterium]NNF82522.1 hypothetical protein [Flavobacteriaceae bacterium]NNK70200.1 hypothetical protein [Flavobacteriaceae bacterium]NNL81142.1 hypothetical protein [Flavobacteriaceae bacterium]
MGTFNTLFLQVYNYYRFRKVKHATRLALFYVTLVQSLLFLFTGVVLAKFLSSMHMSLMSVTTAWVLFAALVVFLYFSNWMQYTGRKQKIFRAKMSQKAYEDRPITILWLIPLLGIFLIVILLNL